ncbi:uncharacterized protein [Rutidosis leptorrhynchoides]|uniref:uncharacterized protein n=1 Tax=Rutidosis leptorrhynchoides TaxID=125765 RepID=UPI003A998BB6
MVKSKLRSWSQDKFGEIDKEIEAHKTAAMSFELKAETSNLTDNEMEIWKNERKLWMDKDKIKVNMMKQKARIRWTLEGDENTKFFHSLIRDRYNKCNIRGLNINGSWNESPDDIKREALDHFQKIFSEPDMMRPSMEDFSYPSVSAEEAEALERPISEDEIHETILDCGSTKAPGPDGFNMKFFKKFWDIIKIELVDAIHWFWDKGEISRGCNASFVTLIPKRSNPEGLGDFRPISLIGSYYKIVAKILSNRLRKILPYLVSSEQSTFLKGHFILDGALIANETVDYLRSKRENGLVFKVDFEKAFDSLNWQFLFEVIKNMGFGNKWIKWINSCLKSASISILINGSPTNEFSLGRGYDKEILYLWVDLSVASRLARYIGCQVGKLPFIYLGLPIGAKMNKVKDWQLVIDNFNSRLSSWKMRSMSFGGRLVLLKSVLTSLPLYYFSLFRAPPSVLKLLESGIWGNIIATGVAMDELQVAFSRSFTKTIGDGGSTLFWLEHWIGSDKLCNLFPRLFRLEMTQNASVKDRYYKSNGQNISSWNWSRIPTGRTAAELDSLINLLSSFEGNCNNPDTWRWAFASNGLFTVKQLSNILDEQILGQFSSQQLTLRNSLVPKKIEIFVWRTLKGRFPVKLELDKRGIDLHSLRCPLCDCDLESDNHALISCKFAEDIWCRIYKWWNVGPFVPSNISDVLGENCPISSTKLGGKLW